METTTLQTDLGVEEFTRSLQAELHQTREHRCFGRLLGQRRPGVSLVRVADLRLRRAGIDRDAISRAAAAIWARGLGAPVRIDGTNRVDPDDAIVVLAVERLRLAHVPAITRALAGDVSAPAEADEEEAPARPAADATELEHRCFARFPESSWRPLAELRVSEPGTEVDGDLEALAQSILECGLAQPIVVRADGEVIVGRRRVQALRARGFEHVPCVVDRSDALRARLTSLDSDLTTRQLTALARAELLSEKKEIYELLYPSTKNGGDRTGQRRGEQTERDSFCRWAGRGSARAIEQYVQIARGLSLEVKGLVHGTEWEDRKTDLLALARESDPDRQRQLTELVVLGRSGELALPEAAMAEAHGRLSAASELVRSVGGQPADPSMRDDIVSMLTLQQFPAKVANDVADTVMAQAIEDEQERMGAALKLAVELRNGPPLSSTSTSNRKRKDRDTRDPFRLQVENLTTLVQVCRDVEEEPELDQWDEEALARVDEKIGRARSWLDRLAAVAETLRQRLAATETRETTGR